MTACDEPLHHLVGTVDIGEFTVPRFGFGTMQLPGPASLGPPRDRDTALAVLRRAVDLGVRFVDTSGYYGPDVANELLAQALRPYPEDLLIASKVGARREGQGFAPADRPEQVRAAVEHDVGVLGLESLALVHARRMPTSSTPFQEMVAALAELREQGLVRNIGVSNVTVAELRAAQQVAPIVSVENEYSLRDRASDDLVELAADETLTFLPFHPLALGDLTGPADVLGDVAVELKATSAQVALAWLLRRSPTILPIPGTSSVAHLEENVAAGALELSEDQVARLDSGPALHRSAADGVR